MQCETAVVRKNTEFVKIISTIANTNDVGHFEIIIYSITLFLVAVSLILVCFIISVLLCNIYGLLSTLGVCVELFVASIPIAMKVVCTSTMALSCFGRERQAILSWLASIEELSGMDVLCCDMSGKLTHNIMTVEWKLPWCETSEQGFDSVDDMRSSSSTSGISMPNFEVLDAKIASALNRIIHDTQFKRKVSLEDQEAQKQDRFLSWKTDRLPDLRVLPGHWRQRFCRELCRPIYICSSK